MNRTDENRRPPSVAPEARHGHTVDAMVRGALEPDQVTADRLVASALEKREGRLAPSRRRPAASRRWQLAAAAVVVLAAVALPILKSWQPGVPPAPREASMPPEASDLRASASLRISNEDGPVTVITPAGSKMVFLPLVLDQPTPGDAL